MKPVPAVFLHIQKTAGTSIIKTAKRHYKGSIIYHAKYVGRDLSDLDDIAFLSGHFGFSFVERFLHNRYSFTFLRNPIDRVLSLYYFCRKQKINEYPIYRLARTLNIEAFLLEGLKPGWVRTHICNHQVWSLAVGWGNEMGKEIDDFEERELLDLATEHLERLTFVGFVESFEADSAIILKSLGISAPQRMLVANSTPNRPGLNELSAEALALVNELTHLDQIFYEKAWAYRHGRSAVSV